MTTLTANDCPDCHSEMHADEGGDRLTFACPTCGAQFAGHVERTGDGIARVVDHRL